jgi:hypothetical protein
VFMSEERLNSNAGEPSLFFSLDTNTRLLLAAKGYEQLFDAARIARCHAGGPRYARLLESPSWEQLIALVSRGGASLARGCSWCLMASYGARGCSCLLAASRSLAPTRPQAARPDERIAHASLRVARSCAW